MDANGPDDLLALVKMDFLNEAANAKLRKVAQPAFSCRFQVPEVYPGAELAGYGLDEF